MRTPLLLAALLALSSCGQDRQDHTPAADARGLPEEASLPPHQVIDRIEGELAGRACIGSLGVWQRTYSFALEPHARPPRLDRNRIHFRYREAKVGGVRAGRRRESALAVTLDHRQRRQAYGSYSIAERRLSLDGCGWNCGPEVPPGGSCG